MASPKKTSIRSLSNATASRRSKPVVAARGLDRTPFGDCHLALADKLARSGRPGARPDPERRVIEIASADEFGAPRTIPALADDPNQREKIAFALRPGGYFQPMLVGSRLAYELPVRDPRDPPRPAMSADVAILRDRPAHQAISPSGEPVPLQVMALLENKIASPIHPVSECLGEFESQAREMASRLALDGRLGPHFAITFLLWREEALSDPDWKSSDYFNGVSGSERMPASRSELEAAASDLLERRGMFACTWLFDLRGRQRPFQGADEFSLRLPPRSFTIAFADRIPLQGAPGLPAAGGSIDARVACADLARMPYVNPTAGGTLQNTRDLSSEPMSEPTRQRLVEGFDLAWAALSEGKTPADVAALFQTRQTGANARRLFACEPRSLLSVTRESGPGVETYWLDAVSCDIALADGQSSSAGFSAIALAAADSPSDFDDFCEKAKSYALRLGASLSGIEDLSRKYAKPGLSAKDRKAFLDLAMAFLQGGALPLIVETPPTQADGARNSRKANSSTPQSSSDIVGASVRDLSKKISSGLNDASVRFGVNVRMADTKSADIELERSPHVNELAYVTYLSAVATRESCDAWGDSVAKRVADGSGETPRAALLGKKGALSPSSDGDLLREALSWAYRASQTLNRSMFEAATHAGDLRAAYAMADPSAHNVNLILSPILAQAEDAAREGGASDVVEAIRSAVDAQKINLRKAGSKRIEGPMKEIIGARLDEMLKMFSTPSFAAMPATTLVEFLKPTLDQIQDCACPKTPNEMAARMAHLILSCREQARLIPAASCSLPLGPMSRMLLGSALLSFGTQTLDLKSFAFADALSENTRRAALCREALETKLSRIAEANKEPVSSSTLKALARLSQDSARSSGGSVGSSLPERWLSRKKTTQAWASAPLWLMHAGIGADGAPSGEISVPPLLVSAP